MRLTIVLLAMMLASCWSGGSGTITSFDGETVVGDLPEEAFRRMCAEIDGWNQTQFGSAAFRRQQCEIEAAAALRNAGQPLATLPSECRQHATICETARAGTPAFPPRCERGPVRCTLTVQQLEQCLYDLAYNMYGLLLTAPLCEDPCGNVDPLSLDAASCATVRATCPGLAVTRPTWPSLDPRPASCGGQ